MEFKRITLVGGRLATVVTACLLAVTSGCVEAKEPEKPEKAENSANAAVPEEPSAPQPLEELERRAAEAEKKLAPLRRAVAEIPDDPRRHAILGKALIHERFNEEAIRHFEIAAELDPDPLRLLDLAHAYEFGARLKEATETYELVLAALTDHPVALFNLGKLAFRRGEFQKAADLHARVLSKNPSHIRAQLSLADSLRELDRLRDAYRAYQKVLRLQPENSDERGALVEALYELAALDLMMGAHERAKGTLEDVLRLMPDHNKAHYAYGQVLMHLGQLEQAQQAFAKHSELLAARESTSGSAMGD